MGYFALGGAAGLLGSILPGLAVGALLAIFSGYLFKACRWLIGREVALWRDIKATRSEVPPKAMMDWLRRLAARREGLDRKYKIIWFSCLFGIMLIFGLIPPKLSGAIFAGMLMASVAVIVLLIVGHQILLIAFGMALRER